MKSKEKIKYILTTIIMAIFIILSINVVSEAETVSEWAFKKSNIYKDSNPKKKNAGYTEAGLGSQSKEKGLFCIEKGHRLYAKGTEYKLVDIIHIQDDGTIERESDGKKITNRKTRAKTAAYALHKADDTVHEWYKEDGKQYYRSDKAMIVWNYITSFTNSIKKDNNEEQGWKKFDSFDVKGIAKSTMTASAKKTLSKAKQYANKKTTTDNKTALKIEQIGDMTEEYWNNGRYFKISLKVNCKLEDMYISSNITGEYVYDDSQIKININGGSYNYIRDYYDGGYDSLNLAEEIIANKTFDLYIPYDENLTEIKVEAMGSTSVSGKAITADIAYLKSLDEQWQNLIVVKTEADDIEIDDNTATITIKRPVGSLQIEKVDKNNHNIKLGGVGFTLKNSDGKYVDSNGQITDTETTLYTDEYGNRTISNIPIGSYTFTETFNPNYGYEVVPESTTINIQGGQNSMVVENEQKYIKIRGRVWEDGQEGKGSTRNNQLDEKEHILGTKKDLNNIWTDNVKVYLKKFERDSNNKLTGRVNTIGNYTTTRDGFYGFDNVEVKYLEDYFVEFEYNGLTYQCVNSGIGGLWENKNSSKAGEDAKSRENLNNKFSIIENGGSANKGVAKDPTENNKIGLDYTINDHVATLNGRKDYYKEGWNTTSNTYNAGLNLNNYYKYLRGDNGFNTDGHPVSKVDEISNVNLGLYKREEPDLAVQKDVQNVQVEINGYGHTYNYDRKETLEKQNNEDAFNVGVKFGSKYTEGYELPIYESDSNYSNKKDPSKELKVYITYKVRLKNQATTIDSKINSLVDYYDSTYEKNGNCDIRINENINDTDKDGKLNSTIEFSKSDYNDKYKKLNINTKGISIGAGETKCIYIQFGLSRTQIASIINDKSEEDRILKNVVEINSYSSYYKGTTNPYGGIDKDSAPGNAVPGDQSTYEDDTDTAPTLKLEVKEARKLTGKVFLDSTNGTLMTGQIREGDGEYKDGEEGIKDITVTLKPINKDPSYAEYSKKTNENGDFTISGFIPNEYEVIYTWGGQELKNGDKITLDKYKGTAYKERERYTLTGPLWYRQNANKRLTDAIDNYEKRQEIDGRYKSIDHNTENIINSIQNEEMSSTTPKMSIRIENMRKRRKNNYIIIR